MRFITVLTLCLTMLGCEAAYAADSTIHAQDVKACADLQYDAMLKVKTELERKQVEKEADFDVWRLDYNRNVFIWHYCTSVAIFVLVSGIVLFGLWLS